MSSVFDLFSAAEVDAVRRCFGDTTLLPDLVVECIFEARVERRRIVERDRCRCERTYVDGTRHGTSLRWWPNGQLRHEYHYNNGKLQGPHKSWFANGQKSFEIYYDNDKPHNESRSWFLNGRIQCETLWEHGTVISTLVFEDDGQRLY